jgi:membrane dipeptidase
MRARVKFWTLTLQFVALSAVLSLDPIHAQSSEDALVKRARGIHERVIALDTHDDINPGNFMLSLNYTQDLATQVTLPKMKKGGLDAAFFIVYVAQVQPGNRA